MEKDKASTPILAPRISPSTIHPSQSRPTLLRVVANLFKPDLRSDRNGNEVFELPRKILGQMGIPHYGTSMVAYTKDVDGIKVWVAKRAESKVS
jgi:hypothetical protein